MNTQVNYSVQEWITKEQEQHLKQFFFFPKTIEEYFILEKFTPEMIQEIRKFIRFFTWSDADMVFRCTNSKDCLYTVAGIIHRIQWEQSIVCNKKDISTRTERILSLWKS